MKKLIRRHSTPPVLSEGNASHESPRTRKAQRLLRQVHADLLNRDPEKYGDWLSKLKAGRAFVRHNPFVWNNPYFERALERLALIDVIYGFGRKADDISDKDAPLPAGWASPADCIEHLVTFVRDRNATDDDLEFLLDYALGMGDALGMDIREGISHILRSLLFDARRGANPSPVILTRAELEENYFLLDEEGTIGLCLMILGESRASFADISLLGMATRIQYTLRDLREDMCKGLCNVPSEDFKALGMYVPDVASKTEIQHWFDSTPTRAWRSKEAARGLSLYAQYEARREQLQVHHLTQAILEFLYERSTKRGLQEALRVA